MKALIALCALSSVSCYGLETVYGQFEDEKDVCLFLKSRIVDPEMITDAQRKQQIEKAKYHKKLADEKFREAEKICLLFPYDDQEFAKKCFRDTIIMSISDKSFAGLIKSLIVVLSDYGYTVYEAWQKQHTLLLEAQYHYEMAEHYTLASNLEVEGEIG